MGDVYTTVDHRDYSMCSLCQGTHKCSPTNSEEKSPQPCTFHSPVLLATETYFEWLIPKRAAWRWGGWRFIFIRAFYSSSAMLGTWSTFTHKIFTVALWEKWHCLVIKEPRLRLNKLPKVHSFINLWSWLGFKINLTLNICKSKHLMSAYYAPGPGLKAFLPSSYSLHDLGDTEVLLFS